LEPGVLAVAILSATCMGEPFAPSPRAAFADFVAPAVVASSGEDEPLHFDRDVERVPAVAHLEVLPVAGFPDAVVAAPWREGRRPVIIVLHGLGDRPETHCEGWRTVTRAEDFVLCPRGDFDPAHSSPGRIRYTLAGDKGLAAHVDAALEALRARYPGRVDEAHPLLAGFSLGATEAAVLALGDPARFPRLALVEGGLDLWFEQRIAAFAAAGAQRVLFGCGSWWCTPSARAASARITASGRALAARVVFADVGHHEVPELQRALAAEFEWLVGDDGRWAEAAPEE